MQKSVWALEEKVRCIEGLESSLLSNQH